MAEEGRNDPSEGESSSSSSNDPEDEPSPGSTPPEESDAEENPEPGDETPDSESEPDEEELTPEELAEEVLQDTSLEGSESEEPSPEEPAEEVGEESEPSEASTEEEPSESPPSEETQPEPSPEEETGDEGQVEESGETSEPEKEQPPETAEDPTEEPPEDVSEETQLTSEPEEPPSEEPDQSEAAGSGSGEVEEEGETSIQDMLEEEAKRSRQEEDEEEEGEELPEGYMTVEQLPEQEEFEIPEWLFTGGWILLWLSTVVLVVWYLAMPLWETYLTNKVRTAVERNDFGAARSWVNTGLFLDGAFIKNDGPFLADYLKQLLGAEEFERYRRNYRALTSSVTTYPRVQQTYVEYLLNRGRWQDALENSEFLQRWVDTRGFGYLFHAKAALELGNFEMARSDLNQVTNWMEQHPASLRVLRDIYFEQGDFSNAQEVSNELQQLTEANDPWDMKVHDYVRLAQINKELGKRRVAQQMLERALQNDPVNKEALKALARQYLLENRWERAGPLVNGSDYRSGYRTLYPFDGFGWWAGAEIALSEGDTARSIQLLERAKDLEPRNPEVHRVEGTLYLEDLGEPAQSVRAFEQAGRFGLLRLEFFAKLGKAYYRSGEYSEAAETFELLRDQLGDTNPALVYNIGSSYLGAGDYDRARDHITKAFDQGFINQKSYNQWGLLLELEGSTQEALAKYFEGIEWGRKNNEPVDLVQSNLDRAFGKRPPEPVSEWLAPLSDNFNVPTWRTLPPGASPFNE